MKESNI